MLEADAMRMVAYAMAAAMIWLVACQGDGKEGTSGQSSEVKTSEDEQPRTVTLWTPGNAETVFMSSRGGDTEVYLTRGIGGSDWVDLTQSDGGDNWPVWSPDGERIAFQSSREDKLDIYVMNADGSGVVQLTDHPEHDYLPAWSPNGTRLTFASWRMESSDSAQANYIYIMNADGTNQRRLFDWSPGTSTWAVWSPDARTFALARAFGEQGTDIVIVDVHGRIVRRLTNDGAANGAPVFSPGGERVAFHADYGDHSEIVVIDVDGGNRRAVVAEGRNWYPDWSPDGRYLLYTTARAGDPEGDLDVMAIPIDGGESTVVAGGPDREAEGRWRPLR
jgi:Tol biopolymer transport system component